MNSYLQRLGLTAWRKKTTLLVAICLLMLLIIGLQYSQSEQNKSASEKERVTPQGLAEAFSQNRPSVKFFDQQKPHSHSVTEMTASNPKLDAEALSKMEMPGHDDIAARKIAEDESKVSQEVEQLLGIPYVNLDLRKPYVPKQRIVHFDLKGAPPLVSFYKKFFPMIKNMGATGILLEYEDMFPYSGVLKNISARNAYTVQQISEILKLARESDLEVIPLVQTFGHVEFVLKHLEFAKLREVPGSPQALCPSRNSSLDFIAEMINQIMDLHPKSKYLHVGCDEVFQMGECDMCRLELHDVLFLRHVRNVANIVHEKRPKLKLIIWDDMLRHLSQQTMMEMGLGDLVEPMVWVYAEDIYRFVQPQVWEKYASVFRTAWTASAFKGAFGETLYVPDAKRHLENNLRWLEVMSQQASSFKYGFTGIVLTGWQRYDHFAVLCELLPAAIPSLALNMITVSHGYFNSSMKAQFLASLSCPQNTAPRNSPFINLDADPHLWDKLGRCMFPGSPFFRLMYRLHTTETEAVEYLRLTKSHKGWMTEYNVRHNYSLPLRVEELVSDLPRVYHGLLSLARSAVDAMADVFDNYTVAEWIEQRIYPYIIELEKLQDESVALKSVNAWPARPLPPLKDLERLGVPIPYK